MGPTAAIISGLAALSKAGAESRAANYNAAVADRNAGVARAQAAADAQLIDRRARQQIGAMRAAFGKAGVALEGSPLDVLEHSASEAEMDKLNTIYKGTLAGIGYGDTAALSRSKASAATAAGIFGAGKAILLGSNPDVPATGVNEYPWEKREKQEKREREEAAARRVPMPKY